MGASAFTQSALNAIGSNVSTNTALLDGTSGYQVGLFVNNVIPEYSMTITSLGESQNPSYARISITTPSTSVGTNSSDQVDLVPNKSALFSFTSPTSPNETVYGYFLMNTASTPSLIYARTLDVPVQIQYPSQLLAILPQVSLSNSCGGN